MRSLSHRFAPRLYSILILLCFAFSGIHAQQWITQNQMAAEPGLYTFHFPTATTGYGVGYDGAMYKTTNSGETWINVNKGTTKNLWGVHFQSASTGWVVGDGGTILATTNGGTTWSEQTSGTTNDLYDVEFFSPTTGIIVGLYGTVLRTTNGGSVWTPQTVAGTNYLYSANVASPTTGYIVDGDSSYLYRTTNAGATWSKITFQNGQLYGYSCTFFSPTIGLYGAGYGNTWRTTDGGVTWNKAGAPSPAYNIYDFAYLDSAQVFAASDGYLFKSTDGGASWTQNLTNPVSAFSSVRFASPTFGVATAYQALYITTNGGAQWTQKIFSKYSNAFVGIKMLSPSTGIATGSSGTIARTTDAGVNWEKQVSGESTVQFNNVAFCNSTHGITVATSGVIKTTTDGGITWNSSPSPTTGNVWSITYPAPELAVASCDSGLIIRSTNGGASWTRVSTGKTPLIRSVSFSDTKYGTAVGWGNTIVHSTNGGVSWTSGVNSEPGEFADANSVSQTDSLTINIVYNNGQFYRSTNGGASWVNYPYELFGVPMYVVRFADVNHGIMAGASGVSFTTTNGGMNWTLKYVDTPYNIYDVSIADKHTAVAAGGGALLARNNLIFGVDLIPPSAPAVISAVAAGPTSVKLSWTKNTEFDLARYRIFAGTSANATVKIDSTSGPSDSTRTITGLTSGTKYYFRIAAVDTARNQSAYSNETNATPTKVFTVLFSSRTIDLGSVKLGSKKDSVITISNTGNDTVKITGVAFSHPVFTSAFSGTTLLAGGQVKDTLRFTPAAIVVVNGYMIVLSNAASSPDTIYLKGTGTPLTGVGTERIVPLEFSLAQNYPNPFNPSTTIEFTLQVSGFTTLKVYDALGREVATLVNKELKAGVFHQKTFDAMKFAGGIYYMRLQNGKDHIVKKMILMK